jgi:hypothetical protein
MRTPVALVLLTAAGFGVGLAAGYRMPRGCMPMPPPASVRSEFRDITRAGYALASSRPELWNEINAKLEKLRPEMDAFRKKINEIDGDFRTQFEAGLTAEQKQKIAEMQRRRERNRDSANAKESAKTAAPEATPVAKPPAPAAPRNDKPERPRVIYEADSLVSALVFVPLSLDYFTDEFGLDANQQVRTKELLFERRRRFLELADTTPPPSMQLLRIADIIRKAQSEEKK